MNRRFFSILAIMAILLSVANLWLLLRGSVGAARLTSASVPQQISYQGRLSEANGNPLNGDVDVRFCLYGASTGGTALWCETYAGVNDTAISVADGVFSVQLGSLSPIPNTLFDGTERYLGVKVGTDSEMSPRRRMTSVGYAYRAESAADADTVDGMQASDFAGSNHSHNTLAAPDGNPPQALFVDNEGQVGIGTTEPGAALEVDGAAIISGGLQADWDSGWVYETNSSIHMTEKTHNLGVYPTRCMVWFSPSNPPNGEIYPYGSCWNNPQASSNGFEYQNPLGWSVNQTSISWHIWSNTNLFKHWNSSTSWQRWDEGYFRVLLWK